MQAIRGTDAPPEVRAAALRRVAIAHRVIYIGTARIVVDAAGTPVRKPNGVPVALPNSPSDHRAYKNLRSVLRHAGIDIEEEQ